MKYDDYVKLLSLPDYSRLKLSLTSAIKSVSREGVDRELIAKKIQALGVTPEISEVVATCLWVRKEEIRTQLIKDSCNISQSKLQDFDWKLKVALFNCLYS